ncbi:MAG: 30S ribosome-binding factor RbfA [Nitrospirae bacterium]|nr:30S ribosome-binding factor RbfA [Nitrospirota bacterium]
MGYQRTERVGDLMRVEIADLLLRKVKDPRIGFVTVTGVKVSPDLRHATVFVSLLEEGRIAEETLNALGRAAGFIRTEMGRRLRLKYTPELVFKEDTTPRQAAHIEAVLDELSGDRTDAAKGLDDGDEDRT